MTASGTLRGGPELRARLQSVATVRVDMLRGWQGDTVKGAKTAAPHRANGSQGGASTIRAGWLSDTKAIVVGAWYLIFKDRGTKAHDIKPKGISHSGRGGTSGNAVLLARNYPPGARPDGKHGEAPFSIFGRKAHVRGIRKSRFITKAAQEAFKENVSADVVERAWSMKRRGGRRSRLA